MTYYVYLCTVFFMVLDLRLTMKIGCRDDNLFFFLKFLNSYKRIYNGKAQTKATARL